MFIDQVNNLVAEISQNDETSLPQMSSVVFIKPVVKHFIDEIKTLYMVYCEKGKSLAVFNSFKECQYFVMSNGLDYHYAN